MNQDHLSAAEVTMFREDTLSSRSLEIGRHLLACKECRVKLPAVTSREFRNCVLDSDTAQPFESKAKRRFFDSPILSIARVSAFAGFVILLAAGIYFVGIDRLGSFETTVAKNEGDADGVKQVNETIAKNPLENEHLPLKGAITPEKNFGPLRSSRKISRPQVKHVATQEKVQNVETRGNGNPCSENSMIFLQSNWDGQEVSLKWNAVKGAQSYAIYISDLDENLIDHFESKYQTVYHSKMRLDPNKRYRWILIIRLENGNRIVGSPQAIGSGTPSESAIKLGEIERIRGAFRLRCVSN